jgi:hypothetical protein
MQSCNISNSSNVLFTETEIVIKHCVIGFLSTCSHLIAYPKIAVLWYLIEFKSYGFFVMLVIHRLLCIFHLLTQWCWHASLSSEANIHRVYNVHKYSELSLICQNRRYGGSIMVCLVCLKWHFKFKEKHKVCGKENDIRIRWALLRGLETFFCNHCTVVLVNCPV